jgi:hypothetical protein
MFDDCSFGTSTASVAVFRYGFDRLSHLSFRYGFDRLSHRGKTATSQNASEISATSNRIPITGGSMAVAEPVEATNI